MGASPVQDLSSAQQGKSTHWSYSHLARSTVRILVPEDPQAEPASDAPGLTSSGIVVRNGLHVLTCFHGVDGAHTGASPIWVFAADSTAAHQARVVRFEPKQDLALLHVPTLVGQPATLARTTEQLRGQAAVLLGFPTSVAYMNPEAPVLSRGLVSQVRRLLLRDIQGRTQALVEVQAFCEAGFSGGPVCSHDYQVIGMTILRKDSGQRWGGYAMAVPAEELRKFVKQPVVEGLEESSR